MCSILELYICYIFIVSICYDIPYRPYMALYLFRHSNAQVLRGMRGPGAEQIGGAIGRRRQQLALRG